MPYQLEEVLGDLAVPALVEAPKARAEAVVGAHDLLDGAVGGHEHRAVLPGVVLRAEHLGPARSKQASKQLGLYSVAECCACRNTRAHLTLPSGVAAARTATPCLLLHEESSKALVNT